MRLLLALLVSASLLGASTPAPPAAPLPGGGAVEAAALGAGSGTRGWLCETLGLFC